MAKSEQRAPDRSITERGERELLVTVSLGELEDAINRVHFESRFDAAAKRRELMEEIRTATLRGRRA